jgi:hypothetical protein
MWKIDLNDHMGFYRSEITMCFKIRLWEIGKHYRQSAPMAATIGAGWPLLQSAPALKKERLSVLLGQWWSYKQ